MRKFLFSLQFFLFASIIILQSCHKNERSCYDDVPTPSYSNPVWHPNGEILGFNRLPLKAVAKDETMCTGYDYDYYADSIGFWLINKDGSDLRRVTNFQLLDPAWSPDGNWIAFCNGGTIYKMAFDGNNFDTAHIVTLTNNGASNFFPAWSSASDTIYYDSNKGSSNGAYFIWKMDKNGNGQTQIGLANNTSTRTPYCTMNNQILHIRYVANNHQQIFSMSSDGNGVTQITSDTLNVGEAANSNYNFIKEYPKFINDKIYYESNGIYTVNLDGSGRVKLCSGSTQNFSISKDGIVAYVNFDYSKLDKILGTVWLMDTNGNNKRQITFNYY